MSVRYQKRCDVIFLVILTKNVNYRLKLLNGSAAFVRNFMTCWRGYQVNLSKEDKAILSICMQIIFTSFRSKLEKKDTVRSHSVKLIFRSTLQKLHRNIIVFFIRFLVLNVTEIMIRNIIVEFASTTQINKIALFHQIGKLTFKLKKKKILIFLMKIPIFKCIY